MHVNLIIPGSSFLKWAKIPAMCHKCCISAQSSDWESRCLPQPEFLTKAERVRTAGKLLITHKARYKIVSFQLFGGMRYEHSAKNGQSKEIQNPVSPQMTVPLKWRGVTKSTFYWIGWGTASSGRTPKLWPRNATILQSRSARERTNTRTHQSRSSYGLQQDHTCPTLKTVLRNNIPSIHNLWMFQLTQKATFMLGAAKWRWHLWGQK